MTSKLASLVSGVFLTLVAVLFFANTRVNSSSDLDIYLSSPKSEYVLGELVLLGVEIKNQSSSDIHLAGTDVMSGYVRIMISSDGATYRRYSNPSWGNRIGKGKIINAGESIKSEASILSNDVPDTSNLSDSAVRAFEEKRLMTIYAFPNQGTFYVKAALIIPSLSGNKEIESEPVQVFVAEPKGPDLEIWDKIKNRADFAYFLQEGEIVDFKSKDERMRFQQEVEEIINNHPDSLFAKSLNLSLNKYRLNEKKRNVSGARMKKH